MRLFLSKAERSAGRPRADRRRWLQAATVAAVLSAALVADLAPVGAEPPVGTDGLPRTRASRNPSDYVVLGNRSVKTSHYGLVRAGNVGVNAANGRLRLGRQSFFDDRTQLVSDLAPSVGGGSSFWEVFSNSFRMPGAAGNAIRHVGPVSPGPLPIIGSVACPAACEPGADSPSVARGSAMRLAPGRYDTLDVPSGARVVLDGGEYCFRDVRLARGARLLFAAPAALQVARQFEMGADALLGRVQGSAVRAADMRVLIAGRSVALGHHAGFTGFLLACDGSVKVGRRAQVRGQVLGDSVRASQNATFEIEACGDGKIDPGEDCDPAGDGACCTADCRFAGAGTSCGGSCDPAAACNECGICVASEEPRCDDGNPCTADSCDRWGECRHEPAPDGGSCGDGDACTGASTCSAGRCEGSPAPECEDGDPATADSCDATIGCRHEILPGRAVCATDEDCPGDACNPSGCLGGACVSLPPPSCDDGNPCTEDACDGANGCEHRALADGSSCEDGNACTAADECRAGRCVGAIRECSDGDGCTADTCDPALGCAHAPIPGCGEGGVLCTFTQDQIGAPDGPAADPHGALHGVLPIAIGGPRTGRSVAVKSAEALQALLPARGRPGPLAPGELTVSTPSDVADPVEDGWAGQGAGSLAGQALALALNLRLSRVGGLPVGLAALPLPEGGFCTCPAAGVGAPRAERPIGECVRRNARTIGGLLDLADQALMGVPLASFDPARCLEYDDIDAGLRTALEAFAGCRSICACSPDSGLLPSAARSVMHQG